MLATELDATGATSGQVLGYDGANLAWTNPTVADGSITNAKIAAGAGIPYSKLTLTNSIQNADIVANAITTSKVANGTVTTSKMANEAITPLQIYGPSSGPGTYFPGYVLISRATQVGGTAVEWRKVLATELSGSGATSGQVLGYDGTNVNWTTPTSTIADGSVTTAKLSATGATTGQVLSYDGANLAWTNATVADGSITNAKIAVGAGITYNKLTLTNSIGNADITANAITTSKVANGTVTTSKMADEAITPLKILGPSSGPGTYYPGYVLISRATQASGTAVEWRKMLATELSGSGATSGQVLGFDGANVVWTTPSVPSDRNIKENFVPINSEEILRKFRNFNLTSWNYKGQDVKTKRHYGPMAQDFYAAFGKDKMGTVGNDTTISNIDYLGVNFAAIQALEKRTQELKTQNDQLQLTAQTLKAEAEKLKTEKASLQKQVADMEKAVDARLAKLEALLSNTQTAAKNEKVQKDVKQGDK